MNQSLSPISDSRNEGAEVSRRLYRNLMETARQLDEIRSHAKITKDLFAIQAQALRTKLQEIAERLLLSNVFLQRLKVDEILWRKGFYDDVSTAKRLRKDNQWSPEERSLLQIHLRSGIGFYHHLLLCIQSEFGISSKCVDFSMVFPDQDYGKSKATAISKQYEVACGSLHRCLICLGDLSRYLLDVPPCGNKDMAYRYYYQALSWNPDVGMPFNQLGTLSMNTNGNLDAVYYYMRCLMCSQPFEGAEGNLKRSFERNAHNVSQERTVGVGSAFWRCHCRAPGGGPFSESQDHVQQFIAHFLLLADLWFFDKKPVANISDLCHQTLLDFRTCLSLSESETGGEGVFIANHSSDPFDNFPSHLSKDMVLKIVVISLICLFNLRRKGSDQASSLVAFLLAMFCTLVQQVQEHIQDSVLNLTLPTVPTPQNPHEYSAQSNGHCSPEEKMKPCISSETEKENGLSEQPLGGLISNGRTKSFDTAEPRKAKRVVRRRHRQCKTSDESDLSNDEDILAISDLSEDDEIVLDLSSDDEEEKASEAEDEDVVILEEINEADETSKSKCVVNGQNGCSISRNCFLKEAANPVDLIEQVAAESLLPAIKICSDWLKGDMPVVKACGKDSPDLFKKFLCLVNCISIDLPKLEKEAHISISLKHRSVLESCSKVPLPEDAQMQRLPFLTASHDNLDWDLIRQSRLTSKEEAIIRIKRLVDFCHFLETVPETAVKYDDKTHQFAVCGKKNIINTDQPISPSIDLQRREEVMHNMGQLWLRAEVQNLETSVKKGTKGASFSPYLVLDVDALTKYFHMVGQLMASRKFIMVVPSVVLSALDQLKRESVLARDAIRWLEFQFQKGTRFLRAQTTFEALHLPLVSYPKQKCREAWSYFQVLECCHYLNHQSSLSYNKDPDASFVTLLTGNNWPDSNGFSPLGVAKAVGIAVEHIESFFTKWKTSSKSHG